MNPEELLRRAFEARTNTVEVAPDALSTIRRRIARRRPARRALTIGLASLATTGAAVAATVALALDGAPDLTQPQPPGTAVNDTSTEGVFPAPVTSSPTTPPPVGVRVPVYYVGAGDRLYREFHATTVPIDTIEARIAAAVRSALDGGAADPDYRSRWPDTAEVRAVQIDGPVANVDLSGVGRSPGSAAAARASVQQLVWTATAVAADHGVNLDGVRLSVDGSRVGDLWGQVDVSGVLARAPADQVQARLWLISPQHGDTVNRDFTVHVYGNVPESNVILRVVSAGGQTVYSEPHTLATGVSRWGEVQVRLTLEPGRYTVQAYFESLEDGSVQSMDDHDVTVR
jgi:hypothetical protein